MFNDTFFPTPKTLSSKMLSPYWDKLGGKYVLDPSAGKGDLLDAIKEANPNHYGRQELEVRLYAVEIEPELQAILREKGYPVVGDDFLLFSPTMRYDLIIMNPPFKDCLDHILRAWQILVEGDVVAVMPDWALEGKEHKSELLLSLIQQHGSVEDAGQAFKTGAERTTDRAVRIVRLHKTDSKKMDFDFDVTNDRIDPEFEQGPGAELAVKGFINELIAAHDASIAAFGEYKAANLRMARYIRPLAEYRRIYRKTEYGTDKYDSEHVKVIEQAGMNYNKFVELLTEAAWTKIMDHPAFQGILTKRAQDMLNEFRQKQRRVDFNRTNVRHFLEAIMGMQDKLLMGAVQDAFDVMTAYHKENQIHLEGWSSNEAYMVSKKVVLPGYIEYGFSSFSISYYRERELRDIDRAMYVVAQRPYDENGTVKHVLEELFRRHFTTYPFDAESEFFYIRGFKKGTIHLTFKEEDQWARFNQLAAQGKGWLPPKHAANCNTSWKQPAQAAQNGFGF